MIHLITYGDDKFNGTKERLYKEALNTKWFDSITLYNQNDLDEKFKSQFVHILKQNRGGGYWIWKPYVVKKKLDEIEYNDILIYLDAGCTINNKAKTRFDEYINMLNNNDMISFQMNHIEKKWTIKEIFNYFNIDINGKEANTGQIHATAFIIKKTINTIKIINEWNEILYKSSSLFTDLYNDQQNDFFIENRHDQSVFSIIRKKYNISMTLQDELHFCPFGCAKSLLYPFWGSRLRF